MVAGSASSHGVEAVLGRTRSGRAGGGQGGPEPAAAAFAGTPVERWRNSTIHNPPGRRPER